MPAYITRDDVRGLAPSAEPSPSAERDAALDDVIGALMERVDAWTGQWFATGYEGSFEFSESDISYGRGDTFIVATPRMFEVTSLETYSDSWETVPVDRYRTGLVYSQKWTGFDTLYFLGNPPWPLRINGKVGWGHGPDSNNPFTGDAVPRRLKIEAEKQARYDLARLPLGGPSGMDIYSNEMTVEIGHHIYLMSAFQTFKNFRDPRRLSVI